VEAAAPIFNQRSYAGSSLNDLMEATGLKKGGIYRRVASKEELAAEAFDYTWEAGCHVMNAAIDTDDGNTVLRARVAKALRFWLSRLQVIVEQARERRETRPGVDPKEVATLIVASLEGALMMSRLQRNDEALRRVQSHLNRYLESDVAA